jgi:hypothetical protein
VRTTFGARTGGDDVRHTAPSAVSSKPGLFVVIGVGTHSFVGSALAIKEVRVTAVLGLGIGRLGWRVFDSAHVVVLIERACDEPVPFLHLDVWAIRKTFAGQILGEVAAIRSRDIVDLKRLLQEWHMLVRGEHELDGLPPSISMGGQTGNARSLKGRAGGLETVEAAQSAIHEGEAIFSGLEKQRVVVASQATVEGGEALRGEFIVGVGAWVDIALWDSQS